METPSASFSQQKRRPRPAVLVVVAIVHIVLFYGLLRALAPGVTGSVERQVVSAFSVTVTTPPPPPPPPAPEPAGAAGDPGKKAVPKPEAAPTPKVRVKEDAPAPRATSTGTANNSGATSAGNGTGAQGSGNGTGAGGSGNGTGGGAATKPVLIATITDVRAFPIPEGGRQARIGKSVDVRLSVDAQGRVTGCTVSRPSPFPETDAVVCKLAYDQVRFTPAKDAAGNPVPSTFTYRQRFFN